MIKDILNYSLLNHNTFGIDARCHRFLEFSSAAEAQQVASALTSGSTPYIIIGGGSNLLLTRDYTGIVVHSAIKGITPMYDGRLRCGSGEVWDDVVAYCVEHGLYGAENLSIIPGDVGASAVQNIGAYGVEVNEFIETVEAIDISSGRAVSFDREECRYSYRNSRFKGEWRNRYLITYVTYHFRPQYNPHIDYGNIRAELDKRGIKNPTPVQLRQCIIDIRNAKLPDYHIEGNAGSFFVNPIVNAEKFNELKSRYPDMPHYIIDDAHIKIPAGWMIEKCGWKGKTVGHAGVHDKQALVLVNRGGATGAEIVHLMQMIQKDVLDTFGIAIHPEVNVV